MRERVEDLGRILVLCEKLFEHDCFDTGWLGYSGRKKDFSEWFSELDQEKKEDCLHKLIYLPENVRDVLDKIWEIAAGFDLLNEEKKC